MVDFRKLVLPIEETEQELVQALELNRYNLEMVKESVKRLSAERLDLIGQARKAGFTAKELCKVTGLSSKRIYELS